MPLYHGYKIRLAYIWKAEPFQRWDRLYTSDSDVYWRQNLTYKDGPRAERIKILKIKIYIMVVDKRKEVTKTVKMILNLKNLHGLYKNISVLWGSRYWPTLTVWLKTITGRYIYAPGSFDTKVKLRNVSTHLVPPSIVLSQNGAMCMNLDRDNISEKHHLGHCVLFICFRSEQNPKSNAGGRYKKHLGKKTFNLLLIFNEATKLKKNIGQIFRKS